MRHLRVWLIPALSSSLALAACNADQTQSPITADDSVAEQRVDAPVSVQRPFMTGDLGKVELPAATSTSLRGRDAMDYADNTASFLTGFALDHLNAQGNEDFEAFSVRLDKGKAIMRFNQRINGLLVKGAQLVVEADAKTGVVSRVNGEFAADTGLSDVPRLGAAEAIERSLRAADIQADQPIAGAELSYVLDRNGNVRLAWETTVEYTDAEGNPQKDVIFADASTGEIAARHPQYHYARSLNTQDCNNKTTNCSTVSTSSNTINTGDAAIDAAHNYAIATYNYYWNRQGRDSIDGNGMTLVSRAHYSVNYNNAFWNGSQMTYGDGDGTTFIPLSQDADVVAHELTHGVTERSSGLIYSNESGALNEALSDMFGAIVDRQEGATIRDTWDLGADIYTPNTPGDALRVMDDPAAAGDYDYYPTRYTGTSDNGGVHWNSGIANLAFALLVEGGSHPRGKTSVVVPALSTNFDTSLNLAGDIFYAANVGCLTPSSNFEAARNCTAAAAGANADAVHLAWDAVGVPGGSGGGGGGGGGGCTTPYSDSLSGISGGRRSKQYYTQDVPSCATTLTISIAGGSGDADLYVRFGSDPTTSQFDCRPYLNGNYETCTFSPPQTGTYHIMLYGYTSYSGVTLTASYQ